MVNRKKVAEDISKELHANMKELHANMNENFKVLRLIYAISFVVGLRELLDHYSPEKSISIIEYLLGSIVLLFLAIRLLWGLSNIRRYLTEKILHNLEMQIDDKGQFNGDIERDSLTWRQWLRILTIDLPVLLSHSFLFFMLTKFLGKIDEQFVNGAKPSHTFIFVVIYSSLLLMNAIWLFTLKTSDKQATSELKKLIHNPEFKWMCNNIAFSILGFSLLIMEFYDVMSFTIVFYIAMVSFLINSLIDFRYAGWTYLLGKPG